MYRHVTLRFTDPPIALVERTRELPVRIIGHPLSRQKDAPFAEEYLLLVRGTTPALDAVEALLATKDGPPPRLDCAEPGARVYQGVLGLPSSGPLRGLITVLGEALGTVLEHEPIVIENGVLEGSLVTIPSRDSALRLRAIEQHAAEAGLGLEVPSHRALAAPTVVSPRLELLDLLQWEVLQALETAGCFDEAAPADREGVVRELADALGIEVEETREIAGRAERRVLQEQVWAWRRNIGLGTPPAGVPKKSKRDPQSDPQGDA
jgi:hypothetical protein